MVVEVGNYSVKALRRSIAVSILCVYVWLTRKTCKDDCSCLKKKKNKNKLSLSMLFCCVFHLFVKLFHPEVMFTFIGAQCMSMTAVFTNA